MTTSNELRALLERVEGGSGSRQVMEAFKALKVSAPTLTHRESLERTHGDREPMKVLGKPCHDCAITCGFYTPYAEDLAKEDAAFQDRIAARWFCHNHPRRACAGVRQFLNRAKLAQEDGNA